jgi:hypothetical protein
MRPVDLRTLRTLWLYSPTSKGGGIAKKEQGSIFFELTSGLGLTNYVSGRLSIYGNDVSIFV